MESLKIPYSPFLYLKDSHVAIYKIYTLKNPFTDKIFYVGQTVQEPFERLSEHIKESDCNKQKSQEIQSIVDQGKKPIIEVIETIPGTCYLDKLMINERELYWIKYYKSIGCTLLNLLGTTANAKCKEYHTYLSCIKRGESSWHYYYCGKTVGGYEVYDERKLKADGFKLPEHRPRPKSNQIIDGYNPWENPRFIAKNGYQKSYEDEFSYVPCYKDTDPNYYDDDY